MLNIYSTWLMTEAKGVTNDNVELHWRVWIKILGLNWRTVTDCFCFELADLVECVGIYDTVYSVYHVSLQQNFSIGYCMYHNTEGK